MTEPAAYIYGGRWGGDLRRSAIYRFRVTKRTAKRIFYARPGERVDQHGELLPDEELFGIQDSDLFKPAESTGSIDRQPFEARGKIHNVARDGGEEKMYATLADLIAQGSKEQSRTEWLEEQLAQFHRLDKLLADTAPADLPALKAAMVAAHPDKGGSSAAFIKARTVYVAARRMQRGAKR